MACAGVGAGVDGVFLEVHQDPPRAKSDAQNALKLDLLPALLDTLVRIHRVRLQPDITPNDVRLQPDHADTRR
jgi:3-deoxy-D-manno-octulosonic acid (KDO) 8-phosphate synthase